MLPSTKQVTININVYYVLRLRIFCKISGLNIFKYLNIRFRHKTQKDENSNRNQIQHKRPVERELGISHVDSANDHEKNSSRCENGRYHQHHLKCFKMYRFVKQHSQLYEGC